MRRLLRFRLRTLFLLVAVLACYLAWRLHDDERLAVEAIALAGGRVHYAFQWPVISVSWIGIGTIPTCIYFSQIEVKRHGPANPPQPTVRELLLGYDQRRVTIAELQFEQMTPQVIAHLKSLKHLQQIVLDMPRAIITIDSPEARRLRELENEFGGKLFPAYNHSAPFGVPIELRYPVQK